jgi:hypothetical protein
MAGVKSRRQVQANNHLAPNFLTENFSGPGGQYGAASRAKGQFEIFAPGTRNDGTPTAEEYSINGVDFYDGYYYTCSKSWNSGSLGIVNKYAAGGAIDASYGCVDIPIQHAADCFFNPSDGRLYVISGTQPGRVFKLGIDGKSVDQTYDLPLTWNQTVGAYDKVNNLLFISYAESSSALTPPTIAVFNGMDIASGPIHSFTMSTSFGVPQGMTVYGGYIYYLVSDHATSTGLAYVAMYDYSGVNVGGFNLNLADEAEGICVASDYGSPYLVVGVVGPTRLLSLRTNTAMRGNSLTSGFNLNTGGGNVTQYPVFLPFSLKREANVWAIHTTINWRGAWGNPVVDSPNKRVTMAIRRNFLSAFLGSYCNFQATFYTLDKCYRLDIAVDQGHYVYFYFRDPTTNAYVDPALITGTCFITGAIVGTESSADAGYDYSS